MLGKLLKHEWKSTMKFPLALSAFILIMTALGCLSFRLPFWQEITTGYGPNFDFFDIIAILILITYYVSIIVAAWVFIIYFGVRFYKNLYTNEGYLMHTLPVTTRQLLISKLLVSALWDLFSSILLVFSIFTLLYACITTIIPKEAWEVAMPILKELLPEMAVVFKQYSGINFSTFVIFMILYAILTCFSSMTMIYACISIGQLFKKHKVAAAVITYLVISTIVQAIASIAIIPVSFGSTASLVINSSTLDPIEMTIAPFASMAPTFLFSAIITIVFSIVYYFVSEYITKRKLNLD